MAQDASGQRWAVPRVDWPAGRVAWVLSLGFLGQGFWEVEQGTVPISLLLPGILLICYMPCQQGTRRLLRAGNGMWMRRDQKSFECHLCKDQSFSSLGSWELVALV